MVSTSAAPYPSPSPRQTPTTFLTLPPEILAHICRHVFTWHRSCGMIAATTVTQVDDASDNSSGRHQASYFTSYSTSCSQSVVPVTTLFPSYCKLFDDPKFQPDEKEIDLKPFPSRDLPRHALALLSTHSHLHIIGSKVFYSMFSWRPFPGEAFRLHFSRHIGSLNLSYIRNLQLELPKPLLSLPARYLPRYISMLRSMRGLERFAVSTSFGRWWRANTWELMDNWTEQHRALLWMAAWVTKRVEGMKWAVWNEQGTVSDNRLDATHAPYWDTRYVTLEVVMTRKRPENGWMMYEDAKRIEERNEGLPQQQQEEVKDVVGLLLDSARIRRWGWEGLGSRFKCRPYSYQMGVDATTSEDNGVDLEALLVRDLDEDDKYTINMLIKDLFWYDQHADQVVMDIQDGKRYPRLRDVIELMFERHRRDMHEVLEEELFQKEGPPPDATLLPEISELDYTNPEFDVMINADNESTEMQESMGEHAIDWWQLTKELLRQRIDGWMWMGEEVLMTLNLKHRPWSRVPRWPWCSRSAVKDGIAAVMAKAKLGKRGDGLEDVHQAGEWVNAENGHVENLWDDDTWPVISEPFAAFSSPW